MVAILLAGPSRQSLTADALIGRRKDSEPGHAAVSKVDARQGFAVGRKFEPQQAALMQLFYRLATSLPWQGATRKPRNAVVGHRNCHEFILFQVRVRAFR